MKILLLDIETSPHQVYCWGYFDQHIDPMTQVVEEGRTICWAAKWLGDRKTEFASVHEDGHEDMVKRIYQLMADADMIVHYNGNRFDIPTLHKEFVLQGLTPPAPSKHVDMLRVVKNRFRFPSNKLDYVAQRLELGKKHPHKGMDLWRECMAGDDGAWRTMKKYNIQDVGLLESLYDRLKGWIPAHPNHGFFSDGRALVCPTCGEGRLIRRGYAHAISRTYQRYQCKGCGAWCRDEVPEKKVGLMRNL